MSIVGLIPARGASRGLSRKNLRPINGVPLIAWSIRAAQESAALNRIIVTTDDPEIADVALSYDAEVPFMRPAALATDETPGIAPVLHAIDQLPEASQILLLQPTSPLRTSVDIRGIISFCVEAQAPCAVSVTRSNEHPEWMFRKTPTGCFAVDENFSVGTHRQHLSETFTINGALYLADSSWLRAKGAFVTPSTLMYEMPPERSLDIDSEFDLRVAELLLTEGTSTPPTFEQ